MFFCILPVSIKKIQQCIVLTTILKIQLHLNLVRHSCQCHKLISSKITSNKYSQKKLFFWGSWSVIQINLFSVYYFFSPHKNILINLFDWQLNHESILSSYPIKYKQLLLPQSLRSLSNYLCYCIELSSGNMSCININLVLLTEMWGLLTCFWCSGCANFNFWVNHHHVHGFTRAMQCPMLIAVHQTNQKLSSKYLGFKLKNH
jgi:hypothetical protein